METGYAIDVIHQWHVPFYKAPSFFMALSDFFSWVYVELKLDAVFYPNFIILNKVLIGIIFIME